MPSRKAFVLVVDDDVRILRMVRRILELESHRVLTASNGEAALDVFDEETPDLVLLDIIMPGIDGYTTCQHIREFSQIPIIMLTVKGKDEDKIQGLDVGADDYMIKPFSAKELVARVRAALRRTKPQDGYPEPSFCSDDLVVDFARRRVNVEEREVNLTVTEYRVLSYLAHNAGRVVTPDQILQKVWGEDHIGETHLLQVSIARLRKKLGDNVKNPRYILTRPGIGYMMVKEDVTR